MKHLFLLSVATTAFAVSIPASSQESSEDREQIMVVLDASGSMWGKIDGKTKIEVVRDVYGTLVKDWEGKDVDAGLIAYGHRKKGDCNDVEVLFKPAPVDAVSYGRAAYKLVPKGKTPLGKAVRMAAEELKYTETKATVILLSDGVETCGIDPCQLGLDLEDLGVDFTAHVVGLDIKSKDDKAQLACLAENTGGTFVTADNAEELQKAVEMTTKTPKEIYDEAFVIQGLLADTGEPASGEVIWELRAADETYNLTSETSRLDLTRMLSTELQAGDYTITGYAGDYAGSETFTLPTEKTKIYVKLHRDVPETRFSYDGDIVAASKFSVGWIGDGKDDDQIVIFEIGGDVPLSVSYVKDGNPLSLVAPSAAGTYELAYLSGGQLRRADHRETITVIEALYKLEPLDEIRAGKDFQVNWTGPGTEGQMVAIGPRTGSDIDYSSLNWVTEGNPLTLTAPSEPGEYELRYYAENYLPLFVVPVTVK